MKVQDTSTTTGKIRVMQAASMGKPLQVRTLLVDDAEWRDVAVDDDWNWLTNDYRIKPKPREFCITIGPNGMAAFVPWHEGLRGTGIHVREVEP